MAGEPIEGYGAGVTGGAGFSTVTVTTLADSGAGSLRAALHSTTGTLGDRIVRFASGLSGNIPLTNGNFFISGRNITFDGVDAPNVTIGNASNSAGFIVDGRNIIFRNLRIRNLIVTPNTGVDGFNMRGGAEGLVFDHCSISEVSDECLSINAEFPGFWAGTASQFGLPLGASGACTIQYCIFGPNRAAPGVAPNGSDQKLMKLGGSRHTSIHHNIFYYSWDRMPRATVGDVCDFRNNIIARWSSGTAPNGFGARGFTALDTSPLNNINNYFAGPDPGFSVNNGWNKDGFDDGGNTAKTITNTFESGTVRWDNGTFPVVGVRATAHTAPAVTTTDAVAAAIATLASAGHPTRDAVDLAAVQWIRDQDARLTGAPNTTIMAASAGSYGVTGNVTSIARQLQIDASGGAYSMVGVPANFEHKLRTTAFRVRK